MKRQFAIISLFVLVLGSSGLASADTMDLALSRLRIRASNTPDLDGMVCPATTSGRGMVSYCAINDDWRRLISQQGFALAPPILSPARTLGFRGFYLGLETGTSGIQDSREYWHQGTEGDAGSRNPFVDSTITWMRLNVRKGLPFGFELGAAIGQPFHSSLWMWGLSIKWSLLEGFDHGLPAIVPDIAIRGSVHTMTGDGQYNLTVPSIDLIVSKGLVLASQATLTPMIGAQLMWMVADSELVDLNPGATPAFDDCLPENGPAPVGGSELRCSASSHHFNDTAVFDQIRARRMRLAIGLQFRFRALTIAGTFHFDLKSPNALDSTMPTGLPRQWNVSSAIGLSY